MNGLIRFLFLLLLISTEALASTVSISLEGVKTQASDLLYQEQKTSPNQILDLIDKGVDASTLDPVETAAWQNQKFPLIDEKIFYPNLENPTVQFTGNTSGANDIYRGYVSYTDKKGVGYSFRLLGSVQFQSIMVRSALLRQLGYPVSSLKLYKSLNVEFKDLNSLDQFFYALFRAVGFVDEYLWVRDPQKAQIEALFSKNRFYERLSNLISRTAKMVEKKQPKEEIQKIVNDETSSIRKQIIDEIENLNKKYSDHTLKEKLTDFSLLTSILDLSEKQELTLQLVENALRTEITSVFPSGKIIINLRDVILEKAAIDGAPPYFIGAIEKRDIANKRAQRALIVPLVLADILESVNIFSPSVGHIQENQGIILNHPMGEQFQGETTIEDVKWILRKVATLTREDWESIVDIAQYPEGVKELVVEKIIARRNHFIKLAGMEGEARPIKVNLKISSKNGIVKRGKLIKTDFPDSVTRYSKGDPISPLRPSEVARYMTIEGINYGIGELTKRINEKLDILTISDLAEERQKDVYDDIIQQILKNPGQPISSPLGVWGGPTGSFGLQATRNVMTGTYYGSDAQVQLVDNVSVRGSVGLFLSSDQFESIIPTVTANVTVQRNYVHVKPIDVVLKADDLKNTELGLKAALRAKVKFMPNLSKLLGTQIEGEEKFTPDELAHKHLENFVNELKKGEMFIVTDSLVGSLRGNVVFPLLNVLGLDPLGLINSTRAGAGFQGKVIRRTVFYRNEKGIQIYLSGDDPHGDEDSGLTNGHITTRKYDLNFDFNWWTNILRFSQASQKGSAKVRAYLLQDLADTKTDEKVTEKRNLEKALYSLFRRNNPSYLEENFSPYVLEHEMNTSISRLKFLFWRRLKVDELHEFKARPPKSETNEYDPKNEERTLYSHRITENVGKNPYAFLSDIIEGFVEGYGFSADNRGDNPANYPFGRARWRNVTTDAEATKGFSNEPTTFIEHHWGGWSISRARVMGIIAAIEQKVKSQSRIKIDLINPDAFLDATTFQLYDISTLFAFSATGAKNIVNKVFKKGGTIDDTFEALVDILPIGRARFDSWCKKAMDNSPAKNKWTKRRDCAAPWMRKIMALYYEKPENTRQKVEWQNKLIAQLEKNISFDQMVDLAGNSEVFYNANITAFRKNDENGDQQYISSALGKGGAHNIKSAFDSFLQFNPILSSEVKATYLSEGYL